MDFPDPPSNLSLRQLRAFWLVANEGSMTRAAARMQLTASALSMLVRALEEELGVRLFERTTRRVELAEAGRQFLPTARDMLFALDAGLRTLEDAQRRKGARLAVVTSPLLAASLMPQVIAGFKAQFPQVAVSLLDAPVDQVAALVREGKGDLGICTADKGAADLIAQPLYEDALVFVCSSGHALAQRREVGWAELAEQSLVLLTPGSGLRKLVDQTLAQAVGAPRAPAFEVANIHTVVGLVQAGLGVSVLPAYSLARVEGHAVVAVALTAPLVTRQVVALCTRARPFSSAAEAFIKQFKKSAPESPV